MLLDGSDQAAANRLFDEIKYQKVVRWLNGDPYLLQRAERNLIATTSSLFIATVYIILLGMALAVVLGVISGFVFYYLRRQKRLTMESYSDGGGLTRLNLDSLTPDITASRLLKE